MDEINLYMIMLGCTPKGRFTEQHDIFFGIGKNLKELIPEMKAFWPEAKGKIHIDAWQKITQVDGFSIEVVTKESEIEGTEKLFFFFFFGYKEGDFEEYHYKVVTVAKSKAEAIKKAKKTTFFKHCGFTDGGETHIDDKYGIDVDDIHKIEDILAVQYKSKYQLKITITNTFSTDEKHIGYLALTKLKK